MASTKKSYSEARHLVVDIETLGVAVPAPILSIGMAMLDCSSGFPATLTVHSIQVNPARCVGSPGTASAVWWMKQSEAARRAALAPEKSVDPWEEFLSLVESFSPDYFWGKSPDFDFGHLEAQVTAPRPIPCGIGRGFSLH